MVGKLCTYNVYAVGGRCKYAPIVTLGYSLLEKYLRIFDALYSTYYVEYLEISILIWIG